MKKYETRIVEISCDSYKHIEDKANEFGQEGWKLVQVERGRSVRLYFQREINGKTE